MNVPLGTTFPICWRVYWFKRYTTATHGQPFSSPWDSEKHPKRFALRNTTTEFLVTSSCVLGSDDTELLRMGNLFPRPRTRPSTQKGSRCALLHEGLSHSGSESPWSLPMSSCRLLRIGLKRYRTATHGQPFSSPSDSEKQLKRFALRTTT